MNFISKSNLTHPSGNLFVPFKIGDVNVSHNDREFFVIDSKGTKSFIQRANLTNELRGISSETLHKMLEVGYLSLNKQGDTYSLRYDERMQGGGRRWNRLCEKTKEVYTRIKPNPAGKVAAEKIGESLVEASKNLSNTSHEGTIKIKDPDGVVKNIGKAAVAVTAIAACTVLSERLIKYKNERETAKERFELEKLRLGHCPKNAKERDLIIQALYQSNTEEANETFKQFEKCPKN